jgi:hypothetical protein
MSGFGEASLVLALISPTIAIFTAAQEIYEAAVDAKGLPKKFRTAAEQIPLVLNALSLAEQHIRAKRVSDEALHSVKPILEQCKESAVNIKDIFDNTIPAKDASRAEQLKKAVGIMMKSNKVKEYMEDLVKNMDLLVQHQVFQDADTLQEIQEAVEQLCSAFQHLDENVAEIRRENHAPQPSRKDTECIQAFSSSNDCLVQ